MAIHHRRWLGTVLLVSALVTSACTGSSGSEDGNSIHVALIADQSGSQAQNGNPLSAGVKAAIRSVNDAGGIDGKKIELTTFDAMTTPQGAQAAVRQVSALRSKPEAVILGTSAASLAVMGQMFEAQPDTTVISGTVLDTYVWPKPAPWFFTIAQPSAGTAEYFVGGLGNVLGNLEGKRIGLVGLENPAVDESLAAMTKQIEGQGGKVVITEHDTAGMTSFASQAANIAAAKPDAVLIYSSVDNTIIDAKALATAGVRAPIIAGAEASDTAVFQKVDADNFYAVRIYNEPEPGGALTKAAEKAGVEQYAQKIYFSRGWAVAQVFINAMNACAAPCENLPGAIEDLGSFPVDGAVIGPVSYSPEKHYGASQAQLFAWKDGKATPMFDKIDITAALSQ